MPISIATKNDHMSENVVPNCLPLGDQKTFFSRTLVSCFASPNVLHLEVLIQTDSVSIQIPWKVTNLLPYTMSYGQKQHSMICTFENQLH